MGDELQQDLDLLVSEMETSTPYTINLDLDFTLCRNKRSQSWHLSSEAISELHGRQGIHSWTVFRENL